MAEISALPRLAYVGDVPVESTVAGAALLYRLLLTWPRERLCIVESSYLQSSPQKRVPGIDYRNVYEGNRRILSTRLKTWYSGRLFRKARRHAEVVIEAIRDFQPECILTVAHGSGWVTADEVAQRLKIPLHLIVHDEPVDSAMVPASLRKSVHSTFQDIYRRARSRMCVSPYMAEVYERTLGIAGDVLLPSRAPASVYYDAPPARLADFNRPLTYAYAGSINTPAYIESLAALGAALGRRGDRLLIFSILTKAEAQTHGLGGEHVECQSIIPFTELINVLRARVDVLFVTMSFEPAHRTNMELSFPSKLTDYTAVGLPLLIRGPAYCSAARWAQDNPGVAMLVQDESSESLAKAVDQLADPALRAALATTAIRIGNASFAHETVFAKFAELIKGGSPDNCRPVPIEGSHAQ